MSRGKEKKGRQTTTSLRFVRGGFYGSGDRTTNIFDEPDFGLKNLIECIFHHRLQEDLTDKAVNLLEYVKRNGKVKTTDFWREGDQTPKVIGGTEYTYSNFQTIKLHLLNCGMFERKKGDVFVLSRKFSFFLDHASDCWRRFFRSEIKKEENVLDLVE